MKVVKTEILRRIFVEFRQNKTKKINPYSWRLKIVQFNQINVNYTYINRNKDVRIYIQKIYDTEGNEEKGRTTTITKEQTEYNLTN